MVESIDIASRLAKAMKLKGWSQGELAIQLGCDRTQVSRWSRGSKCNVEAVHSRLDALLGTPAVIPFPWDIPSQPVAPPSKSTTEYRYLYLSARRQAKTYRASGDEANALLWDTQVGEVAERACAAGEDVTAWEAAWNASNPTTG